MIVSNVALAEKIRVLRSRIVYIELPEKEK
jgi:hypothetical protein